MYDDLGDLSPSFTIEGASNVLISTYNSDGAETTVSQAVKLYQDTLENITKKGTKVNLVNPNLYLWKYADRYLQSPVGTSQYVYETDTVPFLQMVLHGTMEVYAPYANFSFYSATDQLRMIDYNISPSFVLTKQPSYLLASTTSSDYYSTEFEQYEELIQNIYKVVNEPLSQVAGYNWDGRKVLQDGVIENSYSKDGSQKSIVINYTDEDVTVGNLSLIHISFVANGTGGAIFNSSDKKQEAWEFLKWWTSKSVQTEYTYTLRSSYGKTFFWLSANRAALENNPMDEADKKIICLLYTSILRNILISRNFKFYS